MIYHLQLFIISFNNKDSTSSPKFSHYHTGLDGTYQITHSLTNSQLSGGKNVRKVIRFRAQHRSLCIGEISIFF